MHFSASERCSESYAHHQRRRCLLGTSVRTFSFDSFMPGKLASMSFRSLRLVLCVHFSRRSSVNRTEAIAPIRVVLVRELLEGFDELIEGVLHMHMPNVDPYFIFVR